MARYNFSGLPSGLPLWHENDFASSLGSFGMPTTALETGMPASVVRENSSVGSGSGSSLDTSTVGAPNADWAKRNAFGQMFYNRDDNTFSWDALGDAMDVLGGLGNLYFGMQANSLAKKQYGLQKRAFETNLANQIKSYNMALDGRMRAQGVQTGADPESTEEYIRKWSL